MDIHHDSIMHTSTEYYLPKNLKFLLQLVKQIRYSTINFENAAAPLFDRITSTEK